MKTLEEAVSDAQQRKEAADALEREASSRKQAQNGEMAISQARARYVEEFPQRLQLLLDVRWNFGSVHGYPSPIAFATFRYLNQELRLIPFHKRHWRLAWRSPEGWLDEDFYCNMDMVPLSASSFIDGFLLLLPEAARDSGRAEEQDRLSTEKAKREEEPYVPAGPWRVRTPDVYHLEKELNKIESTETVTEIIPDPGHEWFVVISRVR